MKKTQLYARESVVFDHELAIVDSGGAPVDITGWTFALALARRAGSTDVSLGMAASSGDQGFEVVDGPGGVLRIVIDQTTLAGIGDTTGDFTMFGDLLGTPPGGEADLVTDVRMNVTTAGNDFGGSTSKVSVDASGSRWAALAEAAAAASAASSATAEAASGPTYASTAAGLAATPSGQAFAVDNGDGTVTVYLNSAGSAVAQRTLVTSEALSSSSGGGRIGWEADLPAVPETVAPADRTVSAKLGEVWLTPEDFDGTPTERWIALCRHLGSQGATYKANGRVDNDLIIQSRAVLVGKSHFELRGTGTIKIADGAPLNESYCALLVQQCQDFILDGITFDGNRDNRDEGIGSGHLVRILECHRGSFRRIRPINGTTDGFYLAARDTNNGPSGDGPAISEIPSFLTFEDCEADNNYRQGMSIIDGFDITVRGGRFANTNGAYRMDPDGGGPLTAGTGPCAGIDIEPNDQPTWIQQRIDRVLLDGVTFERNDGFGLLVTRVNGVGGVEARDCRFLDSRLGAISAYAEGTKIIRPFLKNWVGIYSAGWTGAKEVNATERGLLDIGPLAGKGIAIKDPVFRGMGSLAASAGSTRYLMYTHSGAEGFVEISGVDVDGSSIRVLLNNAPKLKLEGGFIRSVTSGDAVVLAGPNDCADGVVFYACSNVNIMAADINVVIRKCRAIEPAGSDTFRSVVAGTTFDGNEVERSSAAAGIAFAIGARAKQLTNNRISGFGTNPLSFTGGAPIMQANNVIDAVSYTATTISAAAADNSYNDSANGFIAAGFEVGQTVSVRGFSGSDANNIFSGVITALTAGKMTIGGADGDTIADDAAGETVTIVRPVVVEKDSIRLTDTTTITADLAKGRVFHTTLGGNRTLANPTNMRTGQEGRLRVTQDGTGGRTLAYGTAWKFPGGAPILSTAAGAVDVISYRVHDGSTIEARIEKALS